MIDHNQHLGIESGILVAVPIGEADEADSAAVEQAIKTSLHEAEKNGIVGRDITPYILKRVSQLTKGISLKASM